MKLTLTNQLQDAKYNLNITKQDAQDTTKKLGGVEFKLEKLLDKGSLDTQFGENGVRGGFDRRKYRFAYILTICPPAATG